MEASVRSTYQSYRPRPVAATYPADDSPPPFFARSVSSQRAADTQLNLEALPDSTAKQWAEIDYSRTPVSVFVSNLMVKVDGPDDPIEIEWSYENGAYVYHLTVSDWPEEATINSQPAYFTILNAWDHPFGAEPERATIQIDFEDGAR